MKKLYPVFLLLFSMAATAQKSVDLDRIRFSVQYRSLPAMKLDSSYRTYNVVVESSKLTNPFLQDMSPEKTLKLEGWRQLPKEGHMEIKIKLGDLLPGDVAVKERVVTTKNGNGQVTGTKIFYFQEVVYTFEAEAVISDYKGVHIMDQQLATRNNKRVYRSPEFTIRPLAEGYFVVNSLAITKELYRENVNNVINTLNESLNTNFGFQEVTVNDNMWVIGSRKHPEYTAWRREMQQVNDALFTITANSPIDGLKNQLKSSIEYFEKIKRNYASTNRHDRKIRYAAYYNLAVLYYYLDDPQAMMKEANGLVLNDFDPKDGKAFESTATWLRNIFQQNNIYTRHFKIDINSFRGPFEKAGAIAVN